VSGRTKRWRQDRGGGDTAITYKAGQIVSAGNAAIARKSGLVVAVQGDLRVRPVFNLEQAGLASDTAGPPYSGLPAGWEPASHLQLARPTPFSSTMVPLRTPSGSLAGTTTMSWLSPVTGSM
jgi:hypothetical protein